MGIAKLAINKGGIFFWAYQHWFLNYVFFILYTRTFSVPQLFIKYIEQTFLGILYILYTLGNTLGNVD